MNTIRVRTSSASYPVICGRGSLGQLGKLVAPLRCGGEIIVLSSPRVWKFWGREVVRGLRKASSDQTVFFSDREVKKRLATVEEICRKLARRKADRNAVLIALGGGVVGDVAGFVAAVYLRGVKVVHVPTTVVAQADSAIGGKTGVNLPAGKNLIGAFYQPKMVVADPGVLTTLSPRQFRSGVYEILKYGVVGDPGLFVYLERNLDGLFGRQDRVVQHVIERSVRQKAAIVGEDERESGLRQVLNFGHTMGHALESATGYQCFLHGEAVAWGMLGAIWIGVRLGRLAEGEASRMARLIARCGSLPALPPISAKRLLQIIAGDKKSRGARVGWVIPTRIGATRFGVGVPENLVEMAWRELPAFFARARGATSLGRT